MNLLAFDTSTELLSIALQPGAGAALAWFAEREDAYRAAGMIGPHLPTPPDADAGTRLLAAFGRTASDPVAVVAGKGLLGGSLAALAALSLDQPWPTPAHAAALLGIGWALDDTTTPTQINLTAEDFPNTTGDAP